MNLQEEIEKVVMRYVLHVEKAVRSRARNAVRRNGTPKGARKPSRGARHCKLCAKRGHDARNCKKPKRAVLHVARAA